MLLKLVGIKFIWYYLSHDYFKNSPLFSFKFINDFLFISTKCCCYLKEFINYVINFFSIIKFIWWIYLLIWILIYNYFISLIFKVIIHVNQIASGIGNIICLLVNIDLTVYCSLNYSHELFMNYSELFTHSFLMSEFIRSILVNNILFKCSLNDLLLLITIYSIDLIIILINTLIFSFECIDTFNLNFSFYSNNDFQIAFVFIDSNCYCKL